MANDSVLFFFLMDREWWQSGLSAIGFSLECLIHKTLFFGGKQ
jgi:hypothetical protein